MYACKDIFDFTYIGLNMTCQGMWVARDRDILFSER